MEFKIVEEVHEVNYPTHEENKLSLWKLMISSKKIGISVLCVYLLISEVIAMQFEVGEELAGTVITTSPEERLLAFVILGAIVVLCIIVFTVIIVKIKKCIAKMVSGKKVDKNE